MVQDRIVRQRLDRSHAYERCELQIIDAQLVPVAHAVSLKPKSSGPLSLGTIDHFMPFQRSATVL